MRISDLDNVVRRRGFQLVRVRGSHWHYEHERTHRRLTVAVRNGRHLEPQEVEAIWRDVKRAEA